MQLSSVNFMDGELSIEVTGNDSLFVSASHGQAVVRLNGRAVEFGAIATADVTEIVVTADADSSGNNRIDLSRVTSSRFPQLIGTTLFGGAGNDTILGSGVHDRIDGGSGDDALLGSRGDDILLGDQGNDRIVGGTGSDVLQGGDGRDTLLGQAGDDKLFGGDGRDNLNGQAGADWLQGGDSHNTLRGGGGMDVSVRRNTYFWAW